ncbi:16S rRNA methyltransferase [Neisseria dentiae]|uniref:Ribosomal RNA small subunit methyltransferase J n=1 Tax=Neisseria dentiae TaxID=194197 RepID=A0A1X3DF46_9NEIS|nr:class I SAM-dependent methyltransferase [Neisseria dentiae]OSI18107.1 16S rRNA methyltransferase [Neisseria dentiae]QMT45282.1 class I SAM-dependent methyltransferase [Neisseria dentiae]STZ51048.1 Ribosomal RNA small subunit methyltransferase J [Neisseria dentiae]
MIPVYLTESATESARSLISRFGLTACGSLPQQGEYLLADSDGLSLCRAGEKGRVRADFTGGTAQYRRTKGGGELIAKAVNHTAAPTVWDGTGGLGRDAFVLASLGLQVRAFEQNPAVAALLSDGLQRALECPETAAIANRITLHFGDTCALLPQLAAAGRPDVVYLDPMYPESRKTAAAKKEMAYFHSLVGTAQNEGELLAAARAAAKKRVVVKRPRLGEFLNHEPPAYQYTGKSTRFDVYLPLLP